MVDGSRALSLLKQNWRALLPGLQEDPYLPPNCKDPRLFQPATQELSIRCHIPSPPMMPTRVPHFRFVPTNLPLLFFIIVILSAFYVDLILMLGKTFVPMKSLKTLHCFPELF